MDEDAKLIQSEALGQLEQNCVDSLRIAYLLSALGDGSSLVEPDALTFVAEASMRNALSSSRAVKLLVAALEGEHSEKKEDL
jgi:hypothetical protein